MKTKKLALLGFGNAGQAFAEMLLLKQDGIREKYGYDIVVTAIATNTKGNLVCSEGIDLRKALDDVARGVSFIAKNILQIWSQWRLPKMQIMMCS